MNPSNSLSDRAAIAGIGYTEFSKNSGVSTMELGLRAIMAALEDSGLAPDELDGVATHRVGDSVLPAVLSQALGIKDLRYYVDQFGGGSTSHSIIGQAAMAVSLGIANYVVCYRAINSRSEFRMGGTGRPPIDAVETQYQAPYGYFAPPQQFAMAAQEHMLRYGTTAKHLGSVAIQQREYAVNNERAMMRQPINMDDYLNSRMIVEPFRLLDCCLETDAAVAVIVTTKERARDLKQTPALISAISWGAGSTLYSNEQAELSTSSAATMSARLFDMAGLSTKDIDAAMLYDCFSYSVLVQLEDYGFCKKGEAGDFVTDGNTRLDGVLPVNTHGGFLSEGYAHGLNHVCEAVSQLRGDAGLRQVNNAEVILSTSQPGYVSGNTSALILRKDS